MAVLEKFVAEAPPLQTDKNGTVRVAGTRVTLDTIIARYKKGDGPTAIARSFDVLTEEAVYSVLAYYLRHQNEMDAYLDQRAEEAGRLRAENERRFPMNELRNRLTARINKGKA